MKIIQSKINGVFVLKPNKLNDFRGNFVRILSTNLLKVNFKLKQINSSMNKKKGTIRGLHYFDLKKKEYKIVHCSKGKIFDIIVDMRKKSKTYGKYLSYELSENNSNSIIIPPGVAHGYQTLSNNKQVYYFTSALYAKKYDYGIDPFDETISIKWPLQNYFISDRYKKHKKFNFKK